MNEATSELLADANDIVREQLALAWREHIDRVRDVLEAQWPERMERVLEETIAGLAARLEGEYQDALEARVREAGHTARHDLIQKLNQTARRLRHFENEGQWSHTLMDATRGFCGRAALFLIHDRKLRFEVSRNIDGPGPAPEVSLDAAPAFAAAVETRDTLVAMRAGSELSEPLAAYLGEAPDHGSSRCCLFPIVTRQAVPAVLYADSGDVNSDALELVDVDALELLAATAGAVIDVRPAQSAVPLLAETLVTISATNKTKQEPEILSWFSLSRDDRELHLYAQRFARIQVAEIRLYQSERVKNGRAAHDLYTSLKEEILSAREAFRRKFLNASDSMVDYLHLELVRTLANDDAELLGQDYPGPMV